MEKQSPAALPLPGKPHLRQPWLCCPTHHKPEYQKLWLSSEKVPEVMCAPCCLPEPSLEPCIQRGWSLQRGQPSSLHRLSCWAEQLLLLHIPISLPIQGPGSSFSPVSKEQLSSRGHPSCCRMGKGRNSSPWSQREKLGWGGSEGRGRGC